MLTIFTTAKPFLGHIRIIQRNALQSLRALHPEIKTILLGADEGAAEAAQEFGLRHEPHVERNQWGSKRLDYLFAQAQTIARNEILCYINCDIILMQDFWRAIERVRAMHREFLMVGRRWDTDITEPLQFQSQERHLCSIPRVQRDESPYWRPQDPQAPHWEATERQAPHWEDDLRNL